ncbi:unnamed protein product [Ectocarpus fasciculatus]
MSPHIGILGCGGVGMASASSLIHRGSAVARTITMFDTAVDRCRGEVLDLADQAGFHGTTVRQARVIAQLQGCDILVVAAGAKCRPGESRSALSLRNAAMLHGLVRELLACSVVTSETIVLVATNPVDILTALVTDWLADYVNPKQVIGSGTYIDSQRLRVLLSKRLHVPPRCVRAYVLGEHGDSQVASYDMVTIGTGSLEQCGVTRDEFSEMATVTRKRAQQIVYRKGNTRHCVGECISAICDAIIQDSCAIIPVSVLVPSFNCVFGWPVVLGRTGAERVLPAHLTPEDRSRLEATSNAINASVQVLLKEYPMKSW